MNGVRWAISGQFKGNAEICADEIVSIGEAVTPKDVVNFARNPETELHKCFEWDDAIAAEKYREHTARVLIRSITYEHVDKETEERVPIRIFSHDREESTYKQTVRLVVVEDKYALMLQDAKRELDIFRRKYAILTELEDIIEDIDKILN